MGLGSILGTVAGGVGGFLVGGPAGALIGAGIGGNLGSGADSSKASGDAAKAQIAAANQARGQITDAYNKATGYQQPYYDVGTQNMRNLSSMVNNGAFNTPGYNYTVGNGPNMQFDFQADPGYQWRMQQGTNAINSNAAAAGNQLSGATLKALAKYGQNLASDEYNNAFGRFNQNRNFAQGQYEFGTNAGMSNALNTYNSANQQAQQRYNQFNNLAGMGQTAAGNLANMASNYGASIADTTIGAGNARAAGIVGQANANQNMMGNLGSLAMAGALMGQTPGYSQPNTAQGYFKQTYGNSLPGFLR